MNKAEKLEKINVLLSEYIDVAEDIYRLKDELKQKQERKDALNCQMFTIANQRETKEAGNEKPSI